jgi:type II secretory pathway pseudopilin PulG
MTLVEVVLGAVMLAVVAAAILGAYLSQLALNEHSRNVTLAAQDAIRVVERIREQNTGTAGAGNTCGAGFPNAISPVAPNWDAWLAGAGGKSFAVAANERVVVTCRDSANAVYCNSPQWGATEWTPTATPVAGGPTADPIRVTVSVCWSHRGRTLGECNPVTLAPNNALPMVNDTAAIDSPVMLTTLVTCR